MNRQVRDLKSSTHPHPLDTSRIADNFGGRGFGCFLNENGVGGTIIVVIVGGFYMTTRSMVAQD